MRDVSRLSFDRSPGCIAFLEWAEKEACGDLGKVGVNVLGRETVQEGQAMRG